MCGVSAVSMFGERENKKREKNCLLILEIFHSLTIQVGDISWNTFCIIYVIIYSSCSKLEKTKKQIFFLFNVIVFVYA